MVPGVAVDSTLGLGLASLVHLARLDPDQPPYDWRLEALVQVFVGAGDSGGVKPTLQRYRFRLDWLDVGRPGLRLFTEARFERLVNAGYFGLGQRTAAELPASLADADEAVQGRYFEYDRIAPTLRSILRIEFAPEWELFAGGTVGWTWTNPYAPSRLAEELAAGGRGLVGTERHGRAEGLLGLLWDSRDDEIAPTQGGLHELSLRTGGLVEIDGLYGGLNVTLRQYQALGTDRVVLAGRVLVDAAFGDVPLYALARYGGLWPDDGPGGPLGVRGPRLQRFHGETKAIANLELRTVLFGFSLFGRPTRVGLVAFADAGRVWAERGVDEGGDPLAFALGGGFRYRWGHAFVVRGDLGWSPDGVLFSVDAGHVF